MNEITAREAFDLFKPETCVFVISVDSNKKPNGMIAGWNMKCSADPPLFAVALSRTGYTHELIRGSKEFVIAVPNKLLEAEVNLFGSLHGNETDKFELTKIKTEKARFVHSPLLSEATLNLECQLDNEIEAGDHIIFIGRILCSYKNEGKKVLLNMKKVEGTRIFEEF
jgi:flavin reductase (DIM6/NTAB) family NADH-FMN oxidoreductase RutF